MTIVQIVDAFTFYGVDVILLASLTTVVIQLIKRIVPRSACKKLLTFLPFVIGTVFYAVYAAVRQGDIKYLLDEYISVVEHGFAVGALSTVVYVLYEQFVRGKKQSPLDYAVCANLLDGYVNGDLEKVAGEVADIVRSDVTESALLKVKAKIAENAAEGIDERDVILLAKAVCETLSHIN